MRGVPARLTAVLLVALMGVWLGACSAADPAATATGIVISVDGPNVAEISSFELRTQDGELLVFDVEGLSLTGGGKPAPHLREHMASGEPITVEYRVDDGRSVATRYRDAP